MIEPIERELSGMAAEQLVIIVLAALKTIVAFHIDAANRSRYAKAAHHMCAIRDIYAYLKREDEFRGYFDDIIKQNSRRPALRDEMSVILGKEATKAKK